MSDYSSLAKSMRMTAVRDLLDAGPTPATIEIGTSGMAAVLATITLAKPCGSVTGDALTLMMPEYGAFAVAGGVPAEARMRNGKREDVYTGLLVGTDIAIRGLKNGKLEKGQAVLIEEIQLKHG